MTGGWPGLCLDWPAARQAATQYIHALAKLCSSHACFYAYDTWNEPHIEPAWQRNIWAEPQERLFCYCTKTIEAFHRWLQERYGSVDTLNEVWTRRYPSWEVIDPPRAMGTYTDWVDWRRFIIDRSTRELQFRVNTLREADPNHVFEDHAAHHPPLDATAVNGINSWRLAEVVDTWGYSIFPRWFSFPVFEGAARIEITRSCAGGKDFWMTELQGGHGSRGLWRSPKMRAQDIRLWNWLAVAGGAKGVIYWTYHAEGTGSEATGFGLVARDGSATERVREAAASWRHIRTHWEGIIKDYQPEAEVAVLTDQDNGLLTFAMNGNEDASTESFRGYYRALWNLDLWTDTIEPSQLGKKPYKVLIVPWHLIGKETTCKSLREFVEQGGTLILETAFGMYDDRCFYNPVVPPFGLHESFGYREGESYFVNVGTAKAAVNNVYSGLPRAAQISASDRIYYDPEIDFQEPVRLKVKANTFVTPLTTTSAKAIATCNGMPVAAYQRSGKGQVYYFGTNLGASISAGNDEGIELLRAIIHPIVKPAVKAGKLRPRFIRGRQKGILLAFNDTAENQTDTLDIASLTPFSSARDLYQQTSIAMPGKALQLTVPYQDVAVILLE
jgi:beta-galactosidase